ncbi:hypothetical protein [Streptomyces noursei]
MAAKVTAEHILRRYAGDIADVAEQPRAATLGDFAVQASTAAHAFALAGITGHEEVEAASGYLYDAHLTTNAAERDALLRRADGLLRPIVWDMAQEYRAMVGA